MIKNPWIFTFPCQISPFPQKEWKLQQKIKEFWVNMNKLWNKPKTSTQTHSDALPNMYKYLLKMAKNSKLFWLNMIKMSQLHLITIKSVKYYW